MKFLNKDSKFKNKTKKENELNKKKRWEQQEKDPAEMEIEECLRQLEEETQRPPVVSKTQTASIRPITTTNPSRVVKPGCFDQTDIQNADEILKKPIFKTVYKKTVYKKLNIIFVENTAEVYKEMDKIRKIINTISTSELLCIISYGDKVNMGDILDFSTLENKPTLLLNSNSTDACLYDALVDMEAFASSVYMKVEEKEKEKEVINKIEIIGIGTCKDNCSEIAEEIAINCFCKISSQNNVSTKYYCLTEDSFISAAKIGFRSIGAISQKY